jgi:hypothetical protein
LRYAGKNFSGLGGTRPEVNGSRSHWWGSIFVQKNFPAQKDSLFFSFPPFTLLNFFE